MSYYEIDWLNSFKELSSIFAKHLVLDIWEGSEYPSEYLS